MAPAFALAQNPFPTEPFSDVPASHANYEAVEYLRQNKVLRGYLDGTFVPDRRISRAEFVKLVTNPFVLDTARMTECLQRDYPDTSVSVFKDVPRDTWYINELCHARAMRIVDGYPDGNFRPNAYINVAEAAKILSNVFRYEIAKEDQGELWYKPYVEYLAKLNAIPTSVKTLSQPLKRGEMAEMLYRLKANRTDKAGQPYSNMKF